MTKIRKAADPDAARTIECKLMKSETNHHWNEARVKASKLEFVSFVQKVTYTIKAPAKLTLQNEDADAEEVVTFKRGDAWTYLTYYAEGAFRMEFRKTRFTASQELFDVSEEKGDREHAHDEWLKLTCANGATGWLASVRRRCREPTVQAPAFPRVPQGRRRALAWP